MVNTTTIHALPPELLTQIVSATDACDVARIACVSRRFRELAQSDDTLARVRARQVMGHEVPPLPRVGMPDLRAAVAAHSRFVMGKPATYTLLSSSSVVRPEGLTMATWAARPDLVALYDGSSGTLTCVETDAQGVDFKRFQMPNWRRNTAMELHFSAPHHVVATGTLGSHVIDLAKGHMRPFILTPQDPLDMADLTLATVMHPTHPDWLVELSSSALRLWHPRTQSQSSRYELPFSLMVMHPMILEGHPESLWAIDADNGDLLRWRLPELDRGFERMPFMFSTGGTRIVTAGPDTLVANTGDDWLQAINVVTRALCDTPAWGDPVSALQTHPVDASVLAMQTHSLSLYNPELSGELALQGVALAGDRPGPSFVARNPCNPAFALVGLQNDAHLHGYDFGKRSWSEAGAHPAPPLGAVFNPEHPGLFASWTQSTVHTWDLADLQHTGKIAYRSESHIQSVTPHAGNANVLLVRSLHAAEAVVALHFTLSGA